MPDDAYAPRPEMFVPGYLNDRYLRGDRPDMRAPRMNGLPDTGGRVMEVRTTEPGVQLYTGNHLKHGGFCLETQHYPDSVNRPTFPSTILRPGQTFKSTTSFAFSAK